MGQGGVELGISAIYQTVFLQSMWVSIARSHLFTLLLKGQSLLMHQSLASVRARNLETVEENTRQDGTLFPVSTRDKIKFPQRLSAVILSLNEIRYFISLWKCLKAMIMSYNGNKARCFNGSPLVGTGA